VSLPRTAVVTALGEELGPLLRQAAPVRWIGAGDERYALGELRRRPVVLTATGVGPRAAEKALVALLDRFPTARVVGAGLAGGLSPRLVPAELILAREVRDDGGPVAPPAPWGRAALHGAAREGILLTLDRLLAGRDAKAGLYARLPPDTAAAVDMESSGWARAAASRGVPYGIVRSILDPAEDELPGFLLRCLGPDGRVQRRKVVAHALAHPRDLSLLVDLRRRARVCAERLADFVETLLEIEP
jgi:nucleoside phosphorylase